MKLNLVEFPTSLFTYHAPTKTFVAEASELGNRHLQPLYDDAADRGLALKSEKTGNVVVYVLTKTLTHDNEVVGWDYEPTSESVQKYPECKETRISVMND